MKKLLSLLLASSMALTLGAAAMANTIAVKVDQGTSVSLERPDFGKSAYLVTGKFGINDQTFVSLGYQTESKVNGTIEPNGDAQYQLKSRYAFTNNVAGLFEYTQIKDKSDTYSIGAAAKKELSDPLALAGFAKYHLVNPKNGGDYKEYDLKAQMEYSIFEQLIANAGLEYSMPDSKGAKSYTQYVVGLEFAPTEKVSCYFDYTKNNDNDDSKYTAGIEYKF